MIKFLRKVCKNLRIKGKLSNHFSCILGITLLLTILMSCKTKNTLPDPLKAGWNGQAVCEIVEDNSKVRVIKCSFAPGVGHERHYHNAHFGYAIKGSKFRIRDTTGTREVNVPTGTEFYSKGIEWHEVLNIGDSTAIFLLVEPKAKRSN